MAKGSRGRRKLASRQCRTTPYPIPCKHNHKDDTCPKECPKSLDNNDWKDATCSVCMECPHNAVLLLCSSHDKGCHPYMCGTSSRYSNCLDQYKKAYTKVISHNNNGVPVPSCEGLELLCPLCRGQVKGWTLVEPAREFLNMKKRSCMNENCTFSGNYKELRKHVKAEHPDARPREVDPALEQKWRRFERERERDDVISIMRSSMPGAGMVYGDYVAEGDESDRNRGSEAVFNGSIMNMFYMLHAFGQLIQGGARRASPVADMESSVNGGSVSLVNRLRRQGREVLGRSGRRRRRREPIGGWR